MIYQQLIILIITTHTPKSHQILLSHLIFVGGRRGGGGVKLEKILSHFMFSWCFMLFPTFLEKNKKFRGGGEKKPVAGDLGRPSCLVFFFV